MIFTLLLKKSLEKGKIESWFENFRTANNFFRESKRKKVFHHIFKKKFFSYGESGIQIFTIRVDNFIHAISRQFYSIKKVYLTKILENCKKLKILFLLFLNFYTLFYFNRLNKNLIRP